jgi:hypothetical protein
VRFCRFARRVACATHFVTNDLAISGALDASLKLIESHARAGDAVTSIESALTEWARLAPASVTEWSLCTPFEPQPVDDDGQRGGIPHYPVPIGAVVPNVRRDSGDVTNAKTAWGSGANGDGYAAGYIPGVSSAPERKAPVPVGAGLIAAGAEETARAVKEVTSLKTAQARERRQALKSTLEPLVREASEGLRLAEAELRKNKMLCNLVLARKHLTAAAELFDSVNDAGLSDEDRRTYGLQRPKALDAARTRLLALEGEVLGSVQAALDAADGELEPGDVRQANKSLRIARGLVERLGAFLVQPDERAGKLAVAVDGDGKVGEDKDGGEEAPPKAGNDVDAGGESADAAVEKDPLAELGLDKEEVKKGEYAAAVDRLNALENKVQEYSKKLVEDAKALHKKHQLARASKDGLKPVEVYCVQSLDRIAWNLLRYVQLQ